MRTRLPADYRRYWERFYDRIDNSGLCAYCGDIADCVDHFLPISRAPDYRIGHVTVDACHSCNSIAKDRVFRTVDEKMKFIQGHLRRVFGARLRRRDWDDEDIYELGYALGTFVRGVELRKERIKVRLAWRNQDNPAFIDLRRVVAE